MGGHKNKVIWYHVKPKAELFNLFKGGTENWKGVHCEFYESVAVVCC